MNRFTDDPNNVLALAAFITLLLTLGVLVL